MKNEPMECRENALRVFMSGVGIDLPDYTLLDHALTHASYLAESDDKTLRDYEALEFLGDAVLGLAVAHYLFEELPGLAPGDYTKLRATVVNRNAVARAARKLGIAPLIRLGKGEEGVGGRRRNALLADSLEAVIGAVYKSAGWKTALAFVLKTFSDDLAGCGVEQPAWDYKSMLQTHCQARRYALPQFDVVQSTGPDHRKRFEVEVRINDRPCGRGEGRSKKEAEQNAAYQALKKEKVLE